MGEIGRREKIEIEQADQGFDRCGFQSKIKNHQIIIQIVAKISIIDLEVFIVSACRRGRAKPQKLLLTIEMKSSFAKPRIRFYCRHS